MRMKLVLLSVVLVLGCFAQAAKKAYVLRGKVEEIQPATKSMTVNHEKVEGWMDAMTMTYRVEPEEILKKVKVGDRITGCHGATLTRRAGERKNQTEIDREKQQGYGDKRHDHQGVRQRICRHHSPQQSPQQSRESQRAGQTNRDSECN